MNRPATSGNRGRAETMETANTNANTSATGGERSVTSSRSGRKGRSGGSQMRYLDPNNKLPMNFHLPKEYKNKDFIPVGYLLGKKNISGYFKSEIGNSLY